MGFLFRAFAPFFVFRIAQVQRTVILNLFVFFGVPPRSGTINRIGQRPVYLAQRANLSREAA